MDTSNLKWRNSAGNLITIKILGNALSDALESCFESLDKTKPRCAQFSENCASSFILGGSHELIRGPGRKHGQDLIPRLYLTHRISAASQTNLSGAARAHLPAWSHSQVPFYTILKYIHLHHSFVFIPSSPKRASLWGVHWHRTGWRLVGCALRFTL